MTGAYAPGFNGDMAKRGETRPWRVQFEWANGVKATDTYGDRDSALSAVRRLHVNSHRNGERITVTVSHREQGRSWSGTHDPDACESEHE